MGKHKFSEGASVKDKKRFAPFLAEDEELVVATGYGTNYLRHKFIYYVLWPGGIPFLLAGGVGYFGEFNLGYALLVGLILAILTAYLKTIWTYHAHRYLLTTRRVIIKNGFFAVRLTSALYDKITHIEVEQGFLDRIIMKHGTIIINTAGGGKDELHLFNVDNPIEFKNLLERLINRERERFGGSTGSVVTVEGEVVD